MSTYIDVYTIDEIPEFLRRYIRATPALIPITDNLQGDELLDIDEIKGQLRVTAELYQWLEKEEKDIHEADTYRIDNLVNTEVKMNMGDNYEVMDAMLAILKEDGIV